MEQICEFVKQEVSHFELEQKLLDFSSKTFV